MKQRDALLEQFDAIEHRRFAPVSQPLPQQRVQYDAKYEEFKKRVKTRAGARQLERLKSPQLFFLVQLASAERRSDLADVLTRELARRLRSASPELRFDALTTAIGTASDVEIVRLADTLLPDPRFAVPALSPARALGGSAARTTRSASWCA